MSKLIHKSSHVPIVLSQLFQVQLQLRDHTDSFSPRAHFFKKNTFFDDLLQKLFQPRASLLLSSSRLMPTKFLVPQRQRPTSRDGIHSTYWAFGCLTGFLSLETKGNSILTKSASCQTRSPSYVYEFLSSEQISRRHCRVLSNVGTSGLLVIGWADYYDTFVTCRRRGDSTILFFMPDTHMEKYRLLRLDQEGLTVSGAALGKCCAVQVKVEIRIFVKKIKAIQGRIHESLSSFKKF